MYAENWLAREDRPEQLNAFRGGSHDRSPGAGVVNFDGVFHHRSCNALFGRTL